MTTWARIDQCPRRTWSAPSFSPSPRPTYRFIQKLCGSKFQSILDPYSLSIFVFTPIISRFNLTQLKKRVDKTSYDLFNESLRTEIYNLTMQCVKRSLLPWVNISSTTYVHYVHFSHDDQWAHDKQEQQQMLYTWPRDVDPHRSNADAETGQ